MEPTGFGLLSLLTFLPLFGGLLLLLIPGSQERLLKNSALAISAVTFVLSLFLVVGFNGATYHFQHVEFVRWIDSVGIHYRMGVDGISIWLVALTTFLTFISIWFSFYIKQRVRTYLIAMLVLETAMLGVFLSLDLILFYTFFEASLIPMWLLISVWGGERRIYAGLKFFLFTFAGSIFMLIGMIVLWMLHKEATGVASFSLIDIQSAVAGGQLWAGALQTQAWVFWAFSIALLVKCPAFPFHTWLPDAHVEAPTAGSVILAGVLLKMGTYGFLRFVIPLFPDVLPQNVPILMLLAVIGIIYGAIVAAVQPDVKKLIAYSSVAHMGFVLLGIFSLTHSGLMGGSMQQLNHGVSTGALFLLVGLIYERRHTRVFTAFGGLKAQMPIYSAVFLIIMLSSVGLPGTNGFIGEFLALMGAVEACLSGQFGLNFWYAGIAGGGVVLAAVYLLWMFQKMFYGPNAVPANQRLKDIKGWEIALCAGFVVLVFWGGLFPNTFLKPMEASVGAVRMMALNPVGQRPVWSDTSMEVEENGDLVRVLPRSPQELHSGEVKVLEVIAPAKLHFEPLPPDEPEPLHVQSEIGRGGGL